MIYIFEGISRVGKTTYTTNLSIETGVPYLRISRPSNQVEAFRDPIVLLETIEACNIKNLILDRCYPSEFVYHNKYKFEDIIYLDNLFKNKATIVYLEAPDKVILERWNRDNCFEKLPPFQSLKLRYEEFLNKTQIPVKRIYCEDGMNYEKITI